MQHLHVILRQESLRTNSKMLLAHQKSAKKGCRVSETICPFKLHLHNFMVGCIMIGKVKVSATQSQICSNRGQNNILNQLEKKQRSSPSTYQHMFSKRRSPGFSSVEKIDPAIFKVVGGQDCLINDRCLVQMGYPIIFNYGWKI